MRHKFQLVDRRTIDREIQPETEEALFADLQPIAHFLGVHDGCLFLRVADPALFAVYLDAGFQLSHLFAQVFQHYLALHWVNVHRQVDDFVQVDHAAHPSGEQLARIAVNIKRPGVTCPQAEVGGLKLNRTRRDEIA